MNQYYIETQKLSVGYNGKPLIENISFCVRRGEIMTLIGPNGSGKSTILKTIIGQLKPVAGAIVLDGEDLKKRNQGDIAKRMAILMTERIKPELMTCRDIVGTGRYPYTGKMGILSERDREIVNDALNQVDGQQIADKPFDAISDGQRQRILLARALCQEPEIIILDEPTSFLDIRYKLELLTILKRMVREKNLAVVMSLHEIDLAQRVSDIVVCVNGSQIDKIGTPAEVFSKDYIARLYKMKPGQFDSCFDSLEYVP